MGGRHPVDDAGLVLPVASWPADRQATGELEFVRRFCNSVNLESGAERFRTAAGLDAWLTSEGAAPVTASRSELNRIVAVRDAVRDLIGAGPNGEAQPWAALTALLGDIRLGVAAGTDRLIITPVGRPAQALLGRIALAIADGRASGDWSRLKACQHCSWVVFDPSKNRSSRWCSMQACGGRHNAREYRRRSRSGT